MTNAVPAPRREFWPRLGHHAWKLTIAFDVLLVVSAIANAAGWLAYVYLFLMLTLMRAGAVHERILCESCIAGMPDNPQQEIEHRRRWLRAWHRTEVQPQHRGRFALITLAVLAMYTGSFFFGPKCLGLILFIAIVGVASPLAVITTHFHKRLAPWCPQCRHYGPGQFDPDPTPAPDPARKAPR